MVTSQKVKSGFNDLTLVKKLGIIALVFTAIFLLLILTQPGDLFKAKFKNKLLISFILSIFLTLAYSYQYYFFIKRSNAFAMHIRKYIAYNAVFSLLISIVAFSIIFILHPYLSFNSYKSIFLASIGFVVLLQFVLFFVVKQTYSKATILNSNELEFTFKDNSTTIKIKEEDLFFIKANGNYVDIIEKNKIKGHLIRTSLKEIESTFPELIRCHKSFLVNPNQIKSITGNTKGYEISLFLYNEKIPAARDKGKKIKEMLSI